MDYKVGRIGKIFKIGWIGIQIRRMIGEFQKEGTNQKNQKHLKDCKDQKNYKDIEWLPLKTERDISFCLL